VCGLIRFHRLTCWVVFAARHQQAAVAAGRPAPARVVRGEAEREPDDRRAAVPGHAPTVPVGDRLRSLRDVHQAGAAGRGHLRQGVQGPLAPHRQRRRPQGDQAGQGGGCALHRHPGGVATQKP